jgi:hypothetical protein
VNYDIWLFDQQGWKSFAARNDPAAAIIEAREKGTWALTCGDNVIAFGVRSAPLSLALDKEHLHEINMAKLDIFSYSIPALEVKLGREKRAMPLPTPVNCAHRLIV